MLEEMSLEIKNLILFEFVKNMILSKGNEKLNETNKKNQTEEKNFINHPQQKEIKPVNKNKPFKDLYKNYRIHHPKKIHILKFPEPKIPKEFEYLKPKAIIEKDIEVDMDLLNPMRDDPAIKIIEVNGPGKSVMVRGEMGYMPTVTRLSNEEISQIVKNFSNATRIPIKEGAVEFPLKKYIMSAIISKEAGTKFIIKKLE